LDEMTKLSRSFLPHCTPPSLLATASLPLQKKEKKKRRAL